MSESQSLAHPFDETDYGNYRVITPIDGLRPEELSITVDGRTYHLTQLVSVDASSRVRPDTLVYERLSVDSDSSDAYGVTD